MKDTVTALKQLSPYAMAIAGSILGAYVFTMMFGLMVDDVIPNLGLNNSAIANNTSGYAKYDTEQILVAGADGIYNVAAIVLISTGLMALATVLTAFGMRRFERFNVGAERLAGLMKQIGIVVGIYAVVVFVLAIVRVIFGYLEEKVTTTIGITSATWLTYLDNIVSLATSTINLITPLLDLGVGLVTLALVLAAFGFKIQFGQTDSKKSDF